MVRKAIESTNGGYQLDTLLPVREACLLLGVNSNTLRRWSRLGVLREYRIGAGRHRRFKQGDLAALLVEHRR